MAFRFLTAGESHGKALTGIIEGLPSGMQLTSEMIHAQLKRRKLGYGRGARQKIEGDQVEILSGVRLGQTLGSPISLLILNQDWKSWETIMSVEPPQEHAPEADRQLHVPRPGHADLIGGIKYNHQDMRNVLERSSARETTMRVALASVARQFLNEFEISIASRVVRIGRVVDEGALMCQVEDLNQIADCSPVRCTSARMEQEMIAQIEAVKKEGDTLGGIFEVYASHLPLGLGSYSQWDRRLEAEIGKAFLSLNAVKGVEIGEGFRAGSRLGSELHDEYMPGEKAGSLLFRSNRSGGLDGGMTTGQPLCVRAVMKPLATLMNPLQSVDLKTGTAASAHVERSDVCAVPAAAVIGESLLAFVLAEAVLEKFGGDSMEELRPRIELWRKQCASRCN